MEDVCTGGVDSLGRFGHDGDTCPVHESAEECDCSDEYGPCERHGTTLVIREGASQRTADSLLLLLCHDLIDCGAEVSVWGQEVLDAADKAEENAMSKAGTSWFLGGAVEFDQVATLADQLEAATDLVVIQDDGYRIVRPTDDCPLYADPEVTYSDVIGALIDMGGTK